MAVDFGKSWASGVAMPSNVEQGLTTSAANKITREQLALQRDKDAYERDKEVLLGFGVIAEDKDGTLRLTENATDIFTTTSEGNREAMGDAMGLNEAFGVYTSEDQDGNLIKKRNRKVFPPIVAKEGAVPYSVAQAAAAGDSNAIELQKQYKSGQLTAYVTPLINDRGLFGLLNVFGTDSKDDSVHVYTKSEVETGLQTRVDFLNAEADRTDPDRARAIRRVQAQNKNPLSNVGGAPGVKDYTELVTAVYDDNINRASTNSILKQLETIYNANPKYRLPNRGEADTFQVDIDDTDVRSFIEIPRIVDDKPVDIPGTPDIDESTLYTTLTFEEAYPSLQGLTGSRLATEIDILAQQGAFSNFSQTQQKQIFFNLEQEGIRDVDDLLRKRDAQKVSEQEQYKELLLLNTVMATTQVDTDGTKKLVLENGQTPKEATDATFNAYYTGIPDGNVTAKDLYKDQTSRITEEANLIEQQAALIKNQQLSSETELGWAEHYFEKEKYYNTRYDKLTNDAKLAYNAIQKRFTERTNQILEGTYSGLKGNSPVYYYGLLQELMKGFDFADHGNQTEDYKAVYTKNAGELNLFQTALESSAKDYYVAMQKTTFGADQVELAEGLWMTQIKNPTDEAKELLADMWKQDGHLIWTYNYAQPEGFTDHKNMVDQMYGIKFFSQLQNKEGFWHNLLPALGNSIILNLNDSEYWNDVRADDAKTSIMVNKLADMLAIEYVDGHPVKLVAVNPNTTKELEDSIDWIDLLNTQGVTGDDINWLMQNAKKIGDVPDPTKLSKGNDTKTVDELKEEFLAEL